MYLRLKMRNKDIVVGALVLVVIVSAILISRNLKIKKNLVLPSSTPSIQNQIESKFGNIIIPPDTEKIDLKDVSGGVGMGIATKEVILADLPEPDSGYFYQAWVEKSGKLVSLGKMRIGKGGYIFEGSVEGEKVVVSREKVFDNKPETKILEGSF